jgi:hypothetical protein
VTGLPYEGVGIHEVNAAAPAGNIILRQKSACFRKHHVQLVYYQIPISASGRLVLLNAFACKIEPFSQ